MEGGVITPDEKKELLQIARKTLEVYLGGEEIPVIGSRSPALNEKRGAFVTLEKKIRGSSDWQLRGCIGRLTADKPLIRVVQEMAVQSATGDPRFSTLEKKELADIRIEISVLSPLRPVKDPSEIHIGEHGIQIEKRGRRGLLLPQVAVREGWDLKSFLEYTCLKAGLAPGDWQSKEATLSIFSAEVFHEDL